jgi:predicted NAD/FAD-binding protein
MAAPTPQVGHGPKLRVLVVGGGAAGTAAAWSLCRSAESVEKYAVTLWEHAPVLGGVATTEQLQLPDGTTVRANDGVQGGAVSYRNSLKLHELLGFKPQAVNMTVAFGKAQSTWSNVGAPSELVQRMQPHIERFGRVLRWVDRLNFVYAFVSISTVLRSFSFPADFGERMVYPLTALFFGTGNQTPNVSAAIVARVFLDPQLRLFDYDPQRLLAQSPEMFAFQPLGDIYAALGDNLRAAGAEVCLSRSLAKVQRNGRRAADPIIATDASGATHAFDRIIFACPADVALRCLDAGGGATWWERRVLGSVKYYDDVTYTHSDEAYMREHYELGGSTKTDYYIYTDAQDPSKLEMSFDLGHYQPALRDRPPGSPPIYQSIFLNKASCEASWTLPKMDKGKVLLVKWWHAFSHEVSHFRWVVPFVRFVQGTLGGTTFYAGSWVLANTHEIAVMSGLAAAWRLGAAYPFADDKLATSQFDSLLFLAHGRSRRGC